MSGVNARRRDQSREQEQHTSYLLCPTANSHRTANDMTKIYLFECQIFQPFLSTIMRAAEQAVIELQFNLSFFF